MEWTKSLEVEISTGEVELPEEPKEEEAKYLMEEMMGEEYHKYFEDEKHSL